MRQARYRTEAFSGSQERDAAEVMAFETFELGNTDILECLGCTVLKNNPISDRFPAFIEELDNNGYVDDMGTEDKVAFFREVLAAIEKETGVSVKYALWLADKEVVTDRKWYGRDMADEEDFDSYEIGPIILSDLIHDGALYGYSEMPVCLAERLERLQDELTDIINQRESSGLSPKRAQFLDDRYLEVDTQIQEIRGILGRDHLEALLDETISPEEYEILTSLCSLDVLDISKDDLAYVESFRNNLSNIRSGADELECVSSCVKVEWVNMDEGWNGDYDPENPEDENLLRFDVSVLREGQWEAKEDASYCTQFPANTSFEEKRQALKLLVREYHSALASDIDVSVKKLGEWLSHISPVSLIRRNEPRKKTLSEQIQSASARVTTLSLPHQKKPNREI